MYILDNLDYCMLMSCADRLFTLGDVCMVKSINSGSIIENSVCKSVWSWVYVSTITGQNSLCCLVRCFCRTRLRQTAVWYKNDFSPMFR